MDLRQIFLGGLEKTTCIEKHCIWPLKVTVKLIMKVKRVKNIQL